ncbi:hypothetical protein ACKKBF_B16550 [Auxenochlorella protothecoides x Auxenochlorella symbiontica]
MSQTAPSLLRSLATSFGVSPWARQGARLAPGPLAGRRYSSDEASETGSRQIAYTNRKLAAELAQTNEYLTHAKATALVNQTIELLIAALKRGEAVSLKPLGTLKVAYVGPRRRFDISARQHMLTPGYMKGNLTLGKDMKEHLKGLEPSQVPGS